LPIGKKLTRYSYNLTLIEAFAIVFSDSLLAEGSINERLRGIREEYGEYSRKIYIGGLIGTKGDAYNPDESLSTAEAKSFHRFQVEKLTKAGVDFLIAQTLPAMAKNPSCLSPYFPYFSADFWIKWINSSRFLAPNFL
jgi:S-methylmethionine-dependent homocysteine/selenocysteine methylase